MPRHHEYWYIERLQKYYQDHYLQYDEEVEWYANPEPNKWRFRIPSKKWKVSLTCDDKGNITDEVIDYYGLINDASTQISRIWSWS